MSRRTEQSHLHYGLKSPLDGYHLSHLVAQKALIFNSQSGLLTLFIV